MARSLTSPVETLCRAWLRPRLSDRCFEHCRSTGVTALALAARYGLRLEPDRVREAALLHDAAREQPAAELRALFTPEELRALPLGGANDELLHGPAGARLVERELSVRSPDVLDAIRWHTTGRDRPSDLLTLVLVADYLEPGRPFHGRAPRPEDHGTLAALAAAVQRAKLAWCLEEGVTVAPESVVAYNWYLGRAA